MKTKSLGSLLILSMLALSVGIISATENPSQDQGTLVGGTIYKDVNNNSVYNPGIDTVVDGVTVDVACVHNDVTTHQVVVSHDGGTYGVSFNVNDCDLYDSLAVHVTGEGLTGSNAGEVTDHVLKWNVGIVDVPVNIFTVPEFGPVAGILVVLGALGIFFVVRRK